MHDRKFDEDLRFEEMVVSDERNERVVMSEKDVRSARDEKTTNRGSGSPVGAERNPADRCGRCPR